MIRGNEEYLSGAVHSQALLSFLHDSLLDGLVLYIAEITSFNRFQSASFEETLVARHLKS